VGPLVKRWRRDEEDKVHPHAVMTWKGLAVDKLISEEILVTYVKAAEDLDLSPVLTPAWVPARCCRRRISRRISLPSSCLCFPFDGGSPKLVNQLRRKSSK
jgi:hypothetical protein